MAGAGRQPPGRLRGPLAPAARPELLHDRLGGARVERGGRARAARRRPGAPALPLRRVLPRAGGAGRRRRHARHHARRRRRGGRADRRRAAQGLRAQGARDPADDLDDRVAPPACGRHGARRRPRGATRRVEPVEAGRDRPLLLRRRLAEPRDGAGGAQHERADRVPGPPAAAPLRVRGQRARDQRAEPRRMGRVGAYGSEGAALRDRLRPRSRPRCSAWRRELAEWVRERRRPAVLHLRCVRYLSHAGADAEMAYRTPQAIRDDYEKDPILGTARWLVSAGRARERSSPTTTWRRATRRASSRSRSRRSRR